MNRSALLITSVMLLAICLLGVSSCDRIKGLVGMKKQENKTATSQNPSAQDPATEQQTVSNEPPSQEELAELRAKMPKDKYGRENPFVPLVSSKTQQAKTQQSVQPKVEKVEESEPEREIVIEFITIMQIGSKSSAIISVDGEQKTVSTGDMIDKYEVLGIQEGSDEVLLGAGKENHVLEKGKKLRLKASKGK